MSLPRYIVNPEEVIPYLDPNEMTGDFQYRYETGYQRSKGLRLCSTVESPMIIETWKPHIDIDITGLKIGTRDMEKINRGHISLYINNEEVMTNISLKNRDEYKNLRVRYPISKGDEVKVIYHKNKPSENIDFWIDIDYLGEPLLGKVIVRYIDENGDTIAPSNSFERSLGSFFVVADKIDGYIVTDSYFQEVEITEENINETKEIIFSYIKW